MPNAKPFISLNHVSIRQQGQVMFEGLCWEMLSNQHWAVIGPNGSGKSTLMRALCGSLPIVKGTMVYHFTQVNEHVAAQEHIAYVTFEAQRRILSDEAFYQERWNVGLNEVTLSVSEFLSERGVNSINVYHGAEMRTDKSFASHQREVIEQLELGKLMGRSVLQLSNGERRKVLIARALLRNPRLLILDSPFAGLDERGRKRLTENLEKLMQGEMRIMIVGTDRDEIPSSITHVLRMENNRVVAQKPRQEIVSAAPVAAPSGRPQGSALRTPNSERDLSRKILVQLQNVSVSYNGTAVLHQINWVVRENERWALLGPNGAGKTTLLSLILADNPQAYANDITLFDKRRGSGESIWEIKKNISWVAPELQLYYPRNATCLDVTCSGWFDSVGLYRECSPQQHEIAAAWLERFGLAERAKTEFEKISEGEQRLALLARAMVKDPPLLVLDEPCQGLDVENRDRVLQAINGVSLRPRASMIYVTHRADELPSSITHLLRLSEGQIVEQGAKRN